VNCPAGAACGATFGAPVNPRGAVIIHPYAAGTLKIMGGQAFRAPSVYEQFYQGVGQIPSKGLTPERVLSGEVEYSHAFSSTVTGLVAGYYNHVTDLINLVGDGSTANPLLYVNSTTPVQTFGGEVEVRREWRNGWMLAANYSYQHTSYVNAAAAGLREVPNSPEHLGSFKGAAPVIGSLTAMTRVSFQGPRFDRNDSIADPPQLKTTPSVIWDIVLSGHEDRYGIRYNLGVYNAMDYRYSVPVSPEFTQDMIVQSGRTFLASGQVSF
jgi:outer membrane receptor for ferrienterochelin and colicin